MTGLKLELTCSACPTQYEGTYRNHPVYFRYRHGVWRVDIDGHPVDSGVVGDGLDGIMGEVEAMRIIEKVITTWEQEGYSG